MTASVPQRFQRLEFGVRFLFGVAVAVLLATDLWTILSGILAGRLDQQWPLGPAFVSWSGPLNWSVVTGTVAAGLLWALGAKVWDRVMARYYASERTEEAAEQVSESAEAPKEKAEELKIGQDQQPVRVLNFSGGAFDTVMQLGVTHAITVIQGRAPDAVVGVSAGALNAVALAEILQAGEGEEGRLFADPNFPGERPPADQWNAAEPQLRTTVQKMRLTARAHRLRFYIDQAEKGPAQVLNSLLPDAYQIESTDPLGSLRRPRFSDHERDEREKAAEARSGLIRLYNDLLNIPLAIGTIARFARRVLGWRAAGDIRGWKLWAARLVEGVHLFMLSGMNLHRLAPLGALIFMRLRSGDVTPRSASSLMSKYGPLRKVLHCGLFVFSFGLLLAIWLACALLPLSPFFYFGASFAVALLAVALAGSILFYAAAEQLPWFEAAKDTLEGWVAYFSYTAMWFAIPVAGVVLFRQAGWKEVGWDRIAESARLVWERAWILTGSVAIVVVIYWVLVWLSGRSFVERLLGAYRLDKSLFQTHGMKQFLVRLFDDPDYYGEFVHNGERSMDGVVEASLKGENTGAPRAESPKKVGYYSSAERRAPIHIGLAVANVTTGGIEVVEPEEKLVDALLAAVSVTPFFPPKQLGGKLYIDGTNITNEPTRALLGLLRRHLNPLSRVVHIYSASPFPVSGAELGKEPDIDEYDSLIDVAFRALRLQRFRDATLERRLTELITRVIPEDLLTTEVTVAEETHSFFRAWITPIELDSTKSLNQKLIRASPEQRREAIRERIADGCRAAMQVMVHNSISASAGNLEITSCQSAVTTHLAREGSPPELALLELPGTHEDAPGLHEVCERCKLGRDRPNGSGLERTLQVVPWEETGPDWPHERDYRRQPPESEDDDPHFVAKTRGGPAIKIPDRWPADRDTPEAQKTLPTREKGSSRPVVSFLFSGGVFRGVYQMGVLNALNELNLQPDLIAGASVGSITAAMVAKTFSLPPGPARSGHVARLAAIYLAIDHLVLTDRFADLIRDLTLRAANTRFSIRQADQFFRKYDYPSPFAFDRNARHVLAGIERLFWVSPFQAIQIARSMREGDWPSTWKALGDAVDNWLTQMQVSEEVLGAEPLEQLIYYCVTKGLETPYSEGLMFEDLSRNYASQIFLATATNLTDGKLEVFGAQSGVETILKEGLLASSAFPGVFRPRWSWELRPETPVRTQYIDGGVMDNLPIDAVTTFLACAARDKKIEPHPKTPHLVVAASLEPALRTSLANSEIDRLQRSWPALWGRAQKLSYNTKLDNYMWAEDILSALHRQRQGDTEIDPVDIRIVPIKPEWLCGTFGFHPMLGFRRDRQKRSIAHGCASTLVRFAQVDAAARAGWGIPDDAVPKCTRWAKAFEGMRRKNLKDGECWLRQGKSCPFSPSQLDEVTPALPQDTKKELSDIWRLCREPETQLQAP